MSYGAAMTQHFTGYPTEAMPLLAEIGSGDRDRFRALRDEYNTQILDPTRDLVRDLAGPLQQISPGINAVPAVNGSISPINNDARFHAVPPYKDYVLLRFWEGEDKANSPMLFLRIAPDGIGFGAGWRFAGNDVERYRRAVTGPAGDGLAEILAGLTGRVHGEVIGDQLKRVPAGHASDHRHAALLRRKQLGVTWTEHEPKSFHTARFGPWCARRLTIAGDLHRWLRDNVR